MTKQETANIMAVLKAAYPSFYRNMSDVDVVASVNLWQRLFVDEPYDLVSAAVLALIKTRAETYPPAPGEVTEKIQRLKNPGEITEAEAWSLVSKAIRNGIYGSKEEFAKLPPDVQQAVGSHEQLKEWAIMDSEEVQTVVASNFQRSFRKRQKTNREMEALPSTIKDFVKAFAARMDMNRLDSAEKTMIGDGGSE